LAKPNHRKFDLVFVSIHSMCIKMTHIEYSTSKLGNRYPLEEIVKLDSVFHTELRTMSRTGDNAKCADCGTPNPDWASCNLGIFLCINCAQIHRGLGTHISKVKNCLGTYRWHPDEVQRMRDIGNRKSNLYYLATYTATTRGDMTQHIINKYDKKLWVNTHPDLIDLGSTS
jgi:hypothetical protein